MLLVKDDIHIESHGPWSLTPPFDELVLRVELGLPLEEITAVMSVHATRWQIGKCLGRSW